MQPRSSYKMFNMLSKELRMDKLDKILNRIFVIGLLMIGLGGIILGIHTLHVIGSTDIRGAVESMVLDK